MIESLQQIDLRKYGVLKVFVVGKCGEVNLLDSHLLLALPLNTLIDLAVDSLAETLRCLVGVVSDNFNHDFAHLIIKNSVIANNIQRSGFKYYTYAAFQRKANQKVTYHLSDFLYNI